MIAVGDSRESRSKYRSAKSRPDITLYDFFLPAQALLGTQQIASSKRLATGVYKWLIPSDRMLILFGCARGLRKAGSHDEECLGRCFGLTVRGGSLKHL